MEYNWTPEVTLHTKEDLIGNKLVLQSNGERTEFSTSEMIIMGIHIYQSLTGELKVQVEKAKFLNFWKRI